MIVYVIEEGEYSDKHVEAIKETLDEAKMFVDLRVKTQKQNKYFVERYTISAFDTQGDIIYPDDCYFVRFDKEGLIFEIEKTDEIRDYMDWNSSSEMLIHAKSEEHARKIAYDKLAELKARKAGIV